MHASIRLKPTDQPASQFEVIRFTPEVQRRIRASSRGSLVLQDNGLSPAFNSIDVQCFVEEECLIKFTFGWNSILPKLTVPGIVGFGYRPSWTHSFPTHCIVEDDLDYRFYVHVEHDRLAQRIAFSNPRFVFPASDQDQLLQVGTILDKTHSTSVSPTRSLRHYPG